MKKIVAFTAIILVFAVTMGLTGPNLITNTKLGLDLKGGFEILYDAEPIEPGGKITKQSLIETAKSLQRRIDKLGVAEPEVVTEGSNRIRVKIAGVSNEEEIRSKLKKPSELTFRSNQGCKSDKDYCKVELRGNEFVEGAAEVVYDQLQRPIVSIKVKDKKKFAEISKRLIGKPLAIYMDQELITDPIVQQELTDGSATISGQRTITEAKELADLINLGALPLKLTEKYTQSVGATLGLKSLNDTVLASVIGATIILLFMILYYRVPGLVACFTLFVYSWLILLEFKLIGVTLTLPGIAAFVLGIGMAVDANIIKFERIKEEMRSGKSTMSSLKAGSRHSLRTIMDANVTTLLAAGVMFIMGTGPVKGFALILIMSVLTSIFTNVYLSKLMLTLLISGTKLKPGHFGVKESDIRAL